ncbi:MAG: PAS domain-containing protein [Phaeodactylibacter sp.]|nr:PAS domain-containing protein [Phaeodactylibacter sp.]MCB9299547.1 hypothetical protein [Lewinellaceae bacterium]
MSSEERNLTDAQMLRLKAEERLKEENDEVERLIKEGDAKRLLHELQVHQIELEMQNEALRQANETAEAALKKYTILYDLTPMGYLTLDSEGSILELNFTAAEMLGEKRFSLKNTNFKLFVSEESLPAFNDFFSKVYTSNSKESCELILGYDKKFLCHVYLEGVVAGEEQECLLSAVDISAFKK